MSTCFTEVRETHAGVVFLVGERAYKLKKPVDLGFLDFRTRESRLAACRREVRLNRRLAPDVYLGVADVSDVDGRPCDHLVVMRRMPDHRRLSALVTSGVPVADEIAHLARMIAAFHASARRGAEISAEGSRDAVLARWTDSFAQVESIAVLDRAVLTRIEDLTRAFLAGRAALFDERIAAGRIVDGHGDLLADDIFCLDDGPRVLDCLDFDDRLRYLDGLDDIAFLAMDLERLGAPELGESLLDRYAEFSGDPAPPALREHYLAYRAFVRAKVACLRHLQGDPDAAEQARTYAAITLTHLLAGEVRLTPTDPARSSYLDGIYTPAHTERTYHELLRRAENLLARGESVVLDASWTAAEHRSAARAVATAASGRLVELTCSAPAEVTRARLLARTGSISDADPVIAASMAVAADPWPAAVPVPTGGSRADAVAAALRVVTGSLVGAGEGTRAL